MELKLAKPHSAKVTIARLGIKALAAGSLANLMSAALAGLFLSL